MKKVAVTEHVRERLILSSLVISIFSASPPGILAGLLLIDIALAFGLSVGVMGQIGTVYSIVAGVSALLMGILSVRFGYKSLLMSGLLFLSVSALGCGFAFDFNVMLASYSLAGLGVAMVGPMTSTLVAEYFPLEKRAGAIGWIYASMSLSYVVGAPVIGFIAGLGGWRLAFLGFVLPISLLGFFSTAVSLPSTTRSSKPTVREGKYLEGFREVFFNRSAAACLVSTTLSNAGYSAILLYTSSFYRQRFLVSTGSASIFIVGAALCFTLGSVISGLLVNRLGRKPLTVLATLLAGIFIISYTNLPNQWLSLTTLFLGSLFTGLFATAYSSLALEQVPRFRGTMMSISSVATNIGGVLGAGVGGLALLLHDYELMGVFLGAMGIASALIFHLMVIDPTAIRGKTN